MKEEYLKSETATKKIYYFKNDKEDIDVKSREVFKAKKIEVQYPFRVNGSQKYKYITEIQIEDIDITKIKGLYKSASFGLGFNKYLNPIIFNLESVPRISKIRISPNVQTELKGNTANFNTLDLEQIFNHFKPLKDSQWQEVKRTSNNLLADFFPSSFTASPNKYNKGEISVFIKNKKLKSEDLSEGDIENVLEILPDHIAEKSLFYKTEEKINFIRLNSVKQEFGKLVKQKKDSKTLEEKCQQFFEKNSWIFSNILSTPVALLKSKAFVGGKNYENKNGKIADFLYKNSLTKNVCIVEIKTPRKKLIDVKTPYRKPDVFSMGKELTGGLVQVLDQKDALQKEFYSLSAGAFEAFNPKAILVIGCLSDLDKKQLKSFEIFRSNLKDVEIITFDELLARTELILGQFVEQVVQKKKKNNRI